SVVDRSEDAFARRGVQRARTRGVDGETIEVHGLRQATEVRAIPRRSAVRRVGQPPIRGRVPHGREELVSARAGDEVLYVEAVLRREASGEIGPGDAEVRALLEDEAPADAVSVVQVSEQVVAPGGVEGAGVAVSEQERGHGVARRAHATDGSPRGAAV